MFPDLAGARRRRTIADLVGSLALFGLVAVLALWLHNGGVRGFGGVGGVATEIGRLTGLVSAYLMLLQVLMMARIPWVEGIWGQDRLARWHRWVGFASFDLMLIHIVAITIGYAQSARSGFWWELWTLSTDYAGMLLAVAGTTAMIAVVVTSVRAARRRLRYESWHLIHLYAYLGAGLALPHQLWTGADFTASTFATVFWWGLWGAAALATAIWRLGYPLWRSWRHALVVSRVVRESGDVISIEMTGRELDALGLRAGQFCQWRFLGAPGWTRAHPFTVSAAPTPSHLRISIRQTGDGSRQLVTARAGSRVLIEGPYGVLLAHRRTHRDVLLIAAGVGLTTMRGLAEEILAEGPSDGPGGSRRPSVVVLHRIPDLSRTLFVREFAEGARHGDLRLYGLAGPRAVQSNWWGGTAPVDPVRALRDAVPDIARREVYICGPADWMRRVRLTVSVLGVDRQHAHSEEFAW